MTEQFFWFSKTSAKVGIIKKILKFTMALESLLDRNDSMLTISFKE